MIHSESNNPNPNQRQIMRITIKKISTKYGKATLHLDEAKEIVFVGFGNISCQPTGLQKKYIEEFKKHI